MHTLVHTHSDSRQVHRHAQTGEPELFFDPKLMWGKGRAFAKIGLKKLGLRMLVDVIPLDANLVKGSHGLPVPDPLEKPVFVGAGQPPDEQILPQTSIRDRILAHFGVAGV